MHAQLGSAGQSLVLVEQVGGPVLDAAPVDVTGRFPVPQSVPTECGGGLRSQFNDLPTRPRRWGSGGSGPRGAGQEGCHRRTRERRFTRRPRVRGGDREGVRLSVRQSRDDTGCLPSCQAGLSRARHLRRGGHGVRGDGAATVSRRAGPGDHGGCVAGFCHHAGGGDQCACSRGIGRRHCVRRFGGSAVAQAIGGDNRERMVPVAQASHDAGRRAIGCRARPILGAGFCDGVGDRRDPPGGRRCGP